MSDKMRVLTWNILAAPWAAPRHYPETMDAAVLDRGVRLDLTLELLRAQRDSFDVVCLQEVTLADFDALREALGSDAFTGCAASHERHYWAHWLEKPQSWEPNGTALFVRNGVLSEVAFDNAVVGPYGNHATVATGQCSDGSTIRIASIHLDADDAGRRCEEFGALLEGHVGGRSDRVIIAGDFNTDTSSTANAEGTIAPMLNAEGLVDALTELGCQEPTHPYARPADSYALLARIDHVVVRGFEGVNGRVHDHGMWSLESPAERIEELLRLTGSDHHAVECVLRPTRS